jgi:hypothetical protein
MEIKEIKNRIDIAKKCVNMSPDGSHDDGYYLGYIRAMEEVLEADENFDYEEEKKYQQGR